ncbi:SMR family transporter [Bacillus safensis]|nr:SMR family transporter [Bacillus safensis]
MSWLLLIGAGILEMLCVTMMNQFQKDRHVKWILFIAAVF